MSSYEEQRQQRLQRNFQVMSNLGLASLSASTEESKPTPDPAPLKKKSLLPEEFRRRSSRVADLPKPVYFPITTSAAAALDQSRPPSTRIRKPSRFAKDDEEDSVHSADETPEEEDDDEEEPLLYGNDDDDDDDDETTSKKKRKRKRQFVDSDDDDEDDVIAAKAADTRKSCLQVRALCEELSSLEWIGTDRFVPPSGGAFKEFVMQTIVSPADWPLKFNLFSGIQAFENCLVLFANVGGSLQHEYENAFSQVDSRIEMDWFASSRTTSAMLSRLANPEELVFLFLRVENEPYVNIGPVRVLFQNGSKFRLLLVETDQHVIYRTQETRNRFVRLLSYQAPESKKMKASMTSDKS